MVFCWLSDIFDKACFLIRNTLIHECIELEFYLKSSTGEFYSNIRTTEAICEWKLNCGKYVMNGTDLQLVCYSTFCKQYIASMYYPYNTFS